MKSNVDPRKAQENSDTLPDQAGVYVPPRPVAAISEHRTMDIKAIRLAAELDPRQARTQLRMQAPRRRRRVSPFWIASIGVVLLLGVGTYVALMSEIPLPSSGQSEPEPPPRTAPALPPADTLAPPPPSLPENVDKQAAPSAPVDAAPAERASAGVTARAEPLPAPTPATAEPPAAPRATPRKSKARRDPWLE
jgi:hypothetical protein